MTTRKAVMILEQINPIIKKSTSYVRRLEIDEEDKSIKFINLFGCIQCICVHRHYYAMDADVVEVVRCKDCENWDLKWVSSTFTENAHRCVVLDNVFDGEFYCACGHRRRSV